jgi:N-acetylglucosaminyldiphosphoundecaprenol N-acetyl-beta-D-mannosaminyltransferase
VDATSAGAAGTPSPAGIDRIEFLKVPLDILPPEKLPEAIAELAAAGLGARIVLLSLRDLLRARRNGEYRAYVLGAALVIPISKSITGGARFVTGKAPVRYMPFDFVVQTLAALEERGRSLYLLGGRRRSLQTAERNLRHTFPGLRIVGRCAGFFRRQDEADILTAVRKASPTLVLVGRGVVGDEKWIQRNRQALGNGIQLWCSDLFDVFAERRRRPSRAVFDRGLEGFVLCLRRPWRVFRFLPYLYFKYLTLFYRLFRRR